MIGLAFRENFIREMVPLTDPQKFSPSKVSCYTVPGTGQRHHTGIILIKPQPLTDGLSIRSCKPVITEHPPATVVGYLHYPLLRVISTKKTN